MARLLPAPLFRVRRSHSYFVVLAMVLSVTAFSLTGWVAQPAHASATCQMASGNGRTIVVDGVERSYDIRVPPGSDATTPLVMSLHSSGGTSSVQQAVSGFSGVAGDLAVNDEVARASTTTLGERERFIAVFPQALQSTKGRQWDLRPTGIDVRFLVALTNELHRQGCSSPTSSSVNGYSMGAMMTARLICAAPTLFSGAGMVAGVYPPTPGCRVPSGMSIVGLHGTEDGLVHWSGWLWPALVDLGMESFPYDRAEMMRMWAQTKGCATSVRSSRGAVVVDEYVGCTGSTTHMLRFVGGEHTWNTFNLDASSYLWKVLRPKERNPVHSGAQAITQALPVGPNGVVSAPDAGSVISVDAGIPNASVMGTLTVTNADGSGFAVAYPCTEPTPKASNINFVAGQSVASGVLVRTGRDGRFCIYVSNRVHVLWDQGAETAIPGHAPVRKLDTRDLLSPGVTVPANWVVSVEAGVKNATVIGTLTVTAGRGNGFAVAYPCGEALPLASNVNFATLQSVASGVVVRTDANGRFCVFVSNSVHVVWDQVAETDLASHAPQRKVDTREPNGGGARPAAGSVIEVDAGVPNASVLGTLTVTGGAGNGFAVAYPCGEAVPLASNVNFAAMQSVATGALVRTDTEGRFCVYVSNDVHVLWDQVAETDLPGHTPVRRLDTRAVTQS